MKHFFKTLVIILISIFTLTSCKTKEPTAMQTAEISVYGDMYTESCTFTLTHDGCLKTTIRSPSGSLSCKDKSKKLSNSQKLRINELINKVKKNGHEVTSGIGGGIINISSTIDGVTYYSMFYNLEGAGLKSPYIGQDLVNLTAELVEMSPARKIKELKQYVRECIRN